MLTASQELESILVEEIESVGAAPIKAGNYSNRYTVLAVDPESRHQVARIAVDVDGFKVHYWINQDDPCLGCPGDRGGHYATIGDSRSMAEFVDRVLVAIDTGQEELANG